jgi:hypothetical protein
MSTLFAPFFQQVDSNGAPLSGAKLYFYQTGTSTLLDTYTSSSLSTPNANPVVADSEGRWGPIYLGTSSDYKVILKDASDVTIATTDPVFASSTAGRTAVNDVSYTATASDRLIAYTAISSSRVVTLPAANTFPAGTSLTVVDESGLSTAGKNILASPNGSDTINGANSTVFLVGAPYGSAALESDGTSKWTILRRTASYAALPQGRLTLQSATPVMTSAQTGKTLVYYTPYIGNLVPIYDGTQFYAEVFAEMSNDLTATSTGKAGPAAAANTSNYDLFVWNDGGTVRLTRGPLWTSDTARGTGTGTSELQRVAGIWTNKVAISNGPGANLGTYVGTIRTDGSAQANWQPGAVAANGTAAILGVWNTFNRVEVKGFIGDSTTSWNYSTATVRPANNSSTMRVSAVMGLQEEPLEARYNAVGGNTSGGVDQAGIGFDSTSAFSGLQGASTGNASGTVNFLQGSYATTMLGFHFMQACEYAQATGTTTWYGSANGGQSGMTYSGRF